MSTTTLEDQPVVGLAVVPDEPDADEQEGASTDGQPPQQPPVAGRVAYGRRPEQPKRRRWLRVIWLLIAFVLAVIVGRLIGGGMAHEYRQLTGEAW